MCANINNTPEFITLASFPRAVCHVDCDAFFTSCEQARNPRLAGLPVAVGQERGMVTCPSYAAKQAGVTRGMRTSEAKKLCPRLVLLPGDYELYGIYSERLLAIIRRFTPTVEEYSIDEAFCELTGLRRMYRASYEDIAGQMKRQIARELGITVSVGVSLTKTLAKLCSKHNKPDGLCLAPGNHLHEFLATVPLEQVCGLGPSSVALLRQYGMRQVIDYVRRPQMEVSRLLGKPGSDLWRELRGEPVYPLLTGQKITYASIGKSKTFWPASAEPAVVKAHLMCNLEAAFVKLRRYGLSARRLTVYLRAADFQQTAATGRLSRYSAATLDFTGLGAALFAQVFQHGCRYRASGVVITEIAVDSLDQRDLFSDEAAIARSRRVSAAMDGVNAAYGTHTIYVAAAHAAAAARPHALPVASKNSRRQLKIPLLRLG